MKSANSKGPALHRPKLAVIVADAIADDILDRGLSPGTSLPNEAEMVEQYEVGRGTIREALRLLEGYGVVRVRSGRSGGPVVTTPPPDRLAYLLSFSLRSSEVSFREIVDARLVIEPALAGHAAASESESDRRHLKDLHEELGELAASGKGDRFAEANREFHTTVATMSGNRPLSYLWEAMSAIADGHEVGVRFSADALEETVQAHDRIVQVIFDHDPDTAVAQMTRHLTAYKEYLEEHYPGLLEKPVKTLSLKVTG